MLKYLHKHKFMIWHRVIKTNNKWQICNLSVKTTATKHSA